MKSRILSILALALILVTSLSVTGCGKSEPNFTASELTFSASPVEVGTAVTISATIANSGASGSGDVTLKIDDAVINTTNITIAAKATQTVSFTYTPTAEGNHNVSITPGYKATGVLGVTQTPKGYWDIQYNVSEGSRVKFNYSLVGVGGIVKISNLSTGDGKVTIRVSKTVVNGTRDITLLSAGWQIKSLNVQKISSGVDMDVVMSLTKDANGKLYVQDGVGDVDMSSASSRTTKPMQTDTQGTGTNSPAGSMLVKTVLQGNAHTSVGVDVILPFGLTFTTGTITNVVSIPSSKFNGATLSSTGTPFAKDGALKVADFVGTAGTITTTGTGDCLGRTLVGLTIDFQVEIKLVLTPVSVTSGQ